MPLLQPIFTATYRYYLKLKILAASLGIARTGLVLEFDMINPQQFFEIDMTNPRQFYELDMEEMST